MNLRLPVFMAAALFFQDWPLDIPAISAGNFDIPQPALPADCASQTFRFF
jgi:hypothetical protein